MSSSVVTDGKITQVDSGGLKTYGYDDAFRITGITDASNPANSWTYGYDPLDRLASASNGTVSQGWTYDANGNRLTETGTAPSTYTYSVAPNSNRIDAISGTLPRNYSYDAAGNTTGYAGTVFGYDNRGRMTSASYGGNTASYVYNALGQRVRRVGPSGTTLYTYDESGHLLGEYDGSGAVIQETVWLGDIPVATLRPNGSTVDVYFVHTDHLNTPRLVTQPSNNAVRWSWNSDAFGTNAPNEDPSGLGVFKVNLRFPGQQYDGLVGLYYNYFRDYDAATGRYVESDPIGLDGGYNTYTYVANAPLQHLDPLGLRQICLPGIKCVGQQDDPNWPGKPPRGKKPDRPECKDSTQDLATCMACCNTIRGNLASGGGSACAEGCMRRAGITSRQSKSICEAN